MTSSKPYVVVTGTDFSAQATRALQAAFEQAKHHTPAELHVVHASLAINPGAGYAVPPYAGLDPMPVLSLDEQQTELVRHLDSELAHLPGFKNAGVRVIAHVLLDAPMFAITRLAESLNADVIVLGSHGRHGMARWLLGSVTEAVVRQATCPVLVIPPLKHELPVPSIEPPCPKCLAARQASSGADMWCEQHRERHGRRHTYHQGDLSSSDASLPLVAR
jgi:nucleotide-binding universal stress UspA family protein